MFQFRRGCADVFWCKSLSPRQRRDGARCFGCVYRQRHPSQASEFEREGFMKTAIAICIVALLAAPASGFAEDKPYPDFGSIAKTPPASKEPHSATQPPIALPPASQAPGSQATTTLSREDWRRLMARTPFPKSGCYTAAYPSTQWQEVPCSTAAGRPIRLAAIIRRKCRDRFPRRPGPLTGA